MKISKANYKKNKVFFIISTINELYKCLLDKCFENNKKII